MPRFRATIAYDGTAYHGWQIQPSHPTIQGALAHALHHLTGETTLPQGAGRTDTGVHALAQVAHFDLRCSIPPENLHRALNRSLPPAIRILDLSSAPDNFHARHHARHKTYEYRILPRSADRETICPPFLAPYVWPCPRVLQIDLLNAAAAHILGTHNFTSFAAVNPDQAQRLTPATPSCPVRTIHESKWTLDTARTPPSLLYRITGTGFLHHMVRNLVGTLVECGAGRLPPQAVPGILAARDRQAAGPTAPPHGLFLAEVAY